jgi:hypothetical protein
MELCVPETIFKENIALEVNYWLLAKLILPL